ncbi:hypothetical protein B0T16DRAFT_105260 [Cercophora newfieldiana]|uniref:Uncharacterized protein n=1 Tax=Cercophora newfieldiana TaxID=92897 RepID=A0AA39YHK0_9PEZI|nr:hypothetical protein B0T16DRAFT_105260 [Cercophora newfieldiana]
MPGLSWAARGANSTTRSIRRPSGNSLDWLRNSRQLERRPVCAGRGSQEYCIRQTAQPGRRRRSRLNEYKVKRGGISARSQYRHPLHSNPSQVSGRLLSHCYSLISLFSRTKDTRTYKMCNADGCKLVAYGGFWDIYTMFPTLAIPTTTKFITFPSSELRPRPEPTTENKDAYDAWNAAYQVWGTLRCPGDCQKGYFCRLHGSWITGQEVADGVAPPADRQAKTDKECLALHSDGKKSMARRGRRD